MRLLNTTTLKFEEFIDTHQDRNNPEVSHQAFLARSFDRKGAGWQKIQRCCRLSKQRGFDWTWIDTCCVDKTSSAELSETINSMYAWYRDAYVCYVFMDDVKADVLPMLDLADGEEKLGQSPDISALNGIKAFSNSRWWSRMWTLQELLAPPTVFFYNANDVLLGTRDSLAFIISEVSDIGLDFVTRKVNIHDAGIAQRMSWASSRESTRTEDQAYALLGIFAVNMPLLYGEGAKAFARLQEQIIAQSDDQSILAWGLWGPKDHDIEGVLASAPSDFDGSGRVTMPQSVRHAYHVHSYGVTNQGLAISHNGGLMRMANWAAEYGWRSGPSTLTLQCVNNNVERRSSGTRSRGTTPIRLHFKRREGRWYRAGIEGLRQDPAMSWSDLSLFRGSKTREIVHVALRSPTGGTVLEEEHPRSAVQAVLLLIGYFVHKIPNFILVVMWLVAFGSEFGTNSTLNLMILALAMAMLLWRVQHIHLQGCDMLARRLSGFLA
ncbi:hypothetical protein LTR17_011658 [Elasticomyces elasticus]|nr:hypothetical protein LTR17_011658 [Elasticomyces elasticus]